MYSVIKIDSKACRHRKHDRMPAVIRLKYIFPKDILLFPGVLADEEDGAGTDLRDDVKERPVGMEFASRRSIAGSQSPIHHDIRHGCRFGAVFIDLDLRLVQDITDIEA